MRPRPYGRRSSSFDDERIDAVYLWVDGSDPKFQEELKANWRQGSGAFEESALHPQRFRDNGELRYSLRSLELHAPWIGNIHVVTNGQVPVWLNLSHKRISLVTHEQIFPERSSLPVFNSCAIELNLHRIPGMSRRFLYMNDDLFLGREVRKRDYITSGGGQRLYLEPNPITRRFARGQVHDRAYAYTGAILDRLWGEKRASHASFAYSRSLMDRVCFRGPKRMLPAHIPQLYDREILQDLEDLLAGEFAATRAHKFRSGSDLVLRLLYFYYLMESGRYKKDLDIIMLDWLSEDFHFIMLKDSLDEAQASFARALNMRPRSFCVNDDLGAVAAGHPVLSCFRNFLRTCFPLPSSFEKK